ncbi:uncharacterized protein ARMOST_21439 [Armillaria ostoyae]|uniref:Uncharacterized protein n=1 Tax=Armillaria ostoyae TaxID=47428 RepID=A0A284SA46_ARMOS|nr:uncharacterized protein ARMOST_21439 [Armillaria ostoyae]
MPSMWNNGIHPGTVYSLSEYVDLLQTAYQAALNEEEDSNQMGIFVEMAVKGMSDFQSFGIDIMQDSDAGQVQTGDLCKDFDSYLGIYTHAPYMGEAKLPAIAQDDYHNLSKDVHFEYNFQTPEDPCYKPHRIPNSCLLRFGVNSKICIMFPKLYHAGRGNSFLSEEERSHLYSAVTQAHRRADRLSSHERPATWEAAMLRADPVGRSQKRAQVHHVNLPAHATHEFLEFLLQILNDEGSEPWTRNALYYVECRGLKELKRHSLEDGNFLNTSEALLEEFLGEIAPPIAELGDVAYVDTALEIGQHQAAVLPRTSQHATFISAVLGIPQQIADALATHDFKGYLRQPFALLGEASGCRISYPDGTGVHQAVFIQIYTSDKALVAHPSSKKNAIYLKPSHVLFQEGETYRGAIPPFIQYACQAFAENSTEMDIITRIEARVPYMEAAQVFNGITGQSVRSFVTLHRATVVWGYKYFRAHAFGQVLAWQTTRGQELEWAKLQAVMATLYIIWCFNATLAFDQPWGADEDLVLSCADVPKGEGIGTYPLLKPHRDEDGVLNAPMIWDGALWVRNIALPPETSCPRLQKQTWTRLQKTSWDFYLEKHSLGEMSGARQPNTQLPHPNHIPRRRGPTHSGATSAAPQGRLIHLDYPVNDQPYDMGEDLSVSELEEPEEETRRMSETLAHLVNDTICGVMQSIGSKQNQGASYCKMLQKDRVLCTPDTFKDLNLGAYFPAAWVDPQKSSWTRTIQLTFPHRELQFTEKAQGYRRNEGWTAFCKYRDRISDPEHAKTVVNQVQKEMHSWAWFPYAQKERQVDYKAGSAKCVYWQWPPQETPPSRKEHAIRIAVNPRYFKKLRFDDASDPVLGERIDENQPAPPPPHREDDRSSDWGSRGSDEDEEDD